MKPDNEKLIQVFAETEEFLRSRLPELIEAKASPHIVHRYIEAWSGVANLINDLGDRYVAEDMGCRPVHPQESVLRGIESLHQRLGEIEQRLSGLEGGDRNG